MNSDTIKENEFVFRRLGESFPQFVLDIWSSVPIWLLVITVLVICARVGYRIASGKSSNPGHADSVANDFLWGLVLVLVVFFLPFIIAWFVVATYVLGNKEDRRPSHGDTVARWLSWGVSLCVAALLMWVLIAFSIRDAEQISAATPSMSAFAVSNAALWYGFVGAVFALGTAYTIFMYIKDSRSLRWFWATKLAILRISVYAILCFVFLLPARQTWDRTEKRSRVVILVDISPSVTKVTDEVGAVKPLTRMDVLIKFLTDKQVSLVENLLKTNPVAIYPFGSRLDETPQIIERGANAWGKEEWEAFARYDFRPFLLKGLSDSGKEALRNTDSWAAGNAGSTDWAAAWFARKDDEKLVNGMSEADTKTLRDNIAKLDRRIDVARTIAQQTNVPGSITAAVNRESPNMVQGIIVFSDGRSSLGSDSAYRELRERAVKEKIPIVTVAVGEDRQTSSITITDVQTDDIASPDSGFKVSVEADGINLANKSVPVELDVYYLGKDGKAKDPKVHGPDYTMKVDSTRSPPSPYQITFSPGDIPHGAVEFVIDPVVLAREPSAKVKNIIEESKDAAIRKPVLKEGQWFVRARIPKHENEAFAEAEHVRERDGIQVMQKKLRVLLVAGAPTREFQFLRTFLAREIQDNRAAVTILVQNEAGGKEGSLTPNPGEEIIVRFPNRLDLSGTKIDPKEKPYNLNEYDLIIAFDPDWTEITQPQAEDLKTWVQRQGGGLIYVADRINTYQLARVEQGSRLEPILDILPVLPEDVIAVKIRATARTPRRLYLTPVQSQGSDLLKLYEPPSRPPAEWTPEEKARAEKLGKDPLAGWELFFTDREVYKREEDKVELYPRRGFYSCYPVKEVKAGAPVLAEFADFDDRGEKILRPWLVTNNPNAAWRTCFIGSGEVYRMYAYDKEFYERFWAKLMKYMAAKRNVKVSRGRVLNSKEYISGYPIRLQAQVLNTNARPYGPTEKDIKFKIAWTDPTTGQKKEEGYFTMTAKQGASGFDGYYQGQELADPRKFPPGDIEYTAIVEVPDSAGETLQGKFRIVPSDPEMDNTRPDLPRLLEMASELSELHGLSDTLKNDFANLPKDNGVPKLFFQLNDELLRKVPGCFTAKESRADNRGPMNDLWDRGVEFPESKEDGNFWERNVPSFLAGTRINISWVMLIVITLLCWEWLTRKLLRLA